MATAPANTMTTTTLVGSVPPQTFWLTNLHPDVLLKIFRMILLADKLLHLLDMPEFRYLIRCRTSYFTISPVPFSSEYVEGFLTRLRFGWYVTRDNWAHRQPIYVDEWTLNVHVRHYYLDGI